MVHLPCSYWDIMLKPALDAANKAFNQQGKTFHFAMGGKSAQIWR